MKTITAHVCVSRIRYWSWFVAINFKAPGTINTWVEFILRLNLALAYFAYLGQWIGSTYCVGLSNFLAFFTRGFVTLLVGGRLRIIECIVYIQDNQRTRRTHKKKKKKRKKRKEGHRLDKNSIDISGKGVMQIACTARLLIFFFPLSTRERALCSFISIPVDPRMRRNELVSEGKAERITIQPSVSNY